MIPTAFIIYHDADLDGLVSGTLMRKVIEDRTGFNIVMIPHDYSRDHEEIEIIKKIKATPGPKLIMMGDISFKPWHMKTLYELTRSNLEIDFWWFDHHITAINTSEADKYSSVNGVRKDEVAACKIIYEFFKDQLPNINPMHIHLLHRWDVHEGVNQVDEFNIEWLYVTYYQKGSLISIFDPIDERGYKANLLQLESIRNPNHIAENGRQIIEYENKMDTFRAKDAWVLSSKYVMFAGHPSKVTNHFPNKDCIFFTFLPDGRVKLSFRAQTDDMCLQIAKSYGGGGHQNACGCSITLDQFNHFIAAFLPKK